MQTDALSTTCISAAIKSSIRPVACQAAVQCYMTARKKSTAQCGGSAAAGTFVDAVFWNVDVHSSLYGSPLDVLQLLHRLFAHVLQLTDMIIHIGNLHFACRPGTPGGYLPQSVQTHPCASVLIMHLAGEGPSDATHQLLAQTNLILPQGNCKLTGEGRGGDTSF